VKTSHSFLSLYAAALEGVGDCVIVVVGVGVYVGVTLGVGVYVGVCVGVLVGVGVGHVVVAITFNLVIPALGLL
jgi:hypothetical protein